MLAVQDRLAVRKSRLAVRLAVQVGVSAGARLPALPDMLPATSAEGRLRQAGSARRASSAG